MREKRSIWRKIFVLPAIPTIVIMVIAGVLNVLAFKWELYDARGAAIYIFATYALILGCTGYARLMERWPILKTIFTLPLIPSLLIIIVGAALIIYVFTAGNFGPIAYVAYLLSAYATILAITSYIRMVKELGGSDDQILIGGYKKQYAVKSKALNGLLSGMLLPFFKVVAVSFAYTMMKTAKGVFTGKIGSILLAILSVIFMLAMVVLGPLFFFVGITCIFWWTAHVIRGIVLCAIGLILIILSNQIILHMSEAQRQELAQGF